MFQSSLLISIDFLSKDFEVGTFAERLEVGIVDGESEALQKMLLEWLMELSHVEETGGSLIVAKLVTVI